MQLVFFGLITFVFCYSLASAAPIDQTLTESHEIKREKATAIASRLLKELAGENAFENTEDSNSGNQPDGPHVKLHMEKQHNDEDLMEYLPTIDDLYRMYGGIDENDDESTSDNNELDDIIEQQLLNDLIHESRTPVVDDRMINAEDH